MKINLLFVAILLSVSNIYAQAPHYLAPDISGSYTLKPTVCVSEQDVVRINNMLEENIALLKEKGRLPISWGVSDTNIRKKPTAGILKWPLMQQEGFNYNSYYGISNYVDVNPLFPNHVQDWNCGSRTYDNSVGYNHPGVDIFLWPFPQQMQEQDQIAVVAAASGVIIAKDNGYPDHSCDLNGLPWNAIYIGNTDGTICWYGHLKNNSQTTKEIGEQVNVGEFLGFVGSSGNSSGPHLHFETHDADGNIIDPYAGSCNASPGLWAEQKPYYEPTINALMTHSNPPVFPDCPELETDYKKDYFMVGDDITVGAYFHDMKGDTTTFQIIRPDNTVLNSWVFNTNPTEFFAAYYAYWNNTVDNNWPTGEWKLKASLLGNEVVHKFYVGVNPPTTVSPTDNILNNIRIYPNPSTGNYFNIIGLKDNVTYEIVISDVVGRIVATKYYQAKNGIITSNAQCNPGVYFIKIADGNNNFKIMKWEVLL